jgi:hypothetical protein
LVRRFLVFVIPEKHSPSGRLLNARLTLTTRERGAANIPTGEDAA